MYKKKILPCLLSFILIMASHYSFSQDTISNLTLEEKINLLAKDIKEAENHFNSKDSLVKKLTRENERKDSLNNKDSASVFNAWVFAAKHPETIYPDKNTTENTAGWMFRGIMIIALLFFIYKAFYYFKHTALCKDESYFIDPIDKVTKLKQEEDRPYSYARVQTFWWTMIIINSYTIFYILFGTLIPLNPTCILLLGGGIAIQFFGKTIDKSQRENDQKVNGQTPALHQDNNETKGLFTDILSDENGISMHRLQSVIFNIIYGIAFLGYFFSNISDTMRQYPFITFEGWQLALLGISALGYLGLKTSENGAGTQTERFNLATRKKNLLEEALTEQKNNK